MPSRRTVSALLGSLALHALVAILLVWSLRSKPLPAKPPSMHIVLRQLPALVPPTQPLPVVPTPPKALAIHKVRPPKPPQPIASIPPPHVAPPSVAPSDSPSQSAQRSAAPEQAETPRGKLAEKSAARGVDLLPRISGLGQFGTSTGDPDQHGHLIHNDPSELPDPEAVAAYDAERAKAIISGWASDDLAALRVDRGVIDSYFSDLKHALERETANPPKFDQQGFASRLTKTYVDTLQNYGKTGNPNDPGNPNTSDTWLQQFGDGRYGIGLIAVVEIQQDATGHFTSAVLVKSSGNQLFDAHVMKSAPIAIDKAEPPGPKAAGVHANGIRAWWQFQGRVSYARKVSDVRQDWWHLLVTAPVSLGTVRFDETKGEVYVVDLLHPTFNCDVRLLRVY